MALSSFVSPVVANTAAVAIATFILGYYAGVGRSLFAYNQDSRRRLLQGGDLAEDDDEDESGSEWEELQDEQGRRMVRNRAGRILEECKMILVVRTDIKMDKGKIAAQHATLAAYKAALRQTPEWVQHWERTGQAKVAVKCNTQEDMLEVENQARRAGVAARVIRDAGRTQVAAGTMTVIGVGPAPRSILDTITGGFKLL